VEAALRSAPAASPDVRGIVVAKELFMPSTSGAGAGASVDAELTVSLVAEQGSLSGFVDLIEWLKIQDYEFDHFRCSDEDSAVIDYLYDADGIPVRGRIAAGGEAEIVVESRSAGPGTSIGGSENDVDSAKDTIRCSAALGPLVVRR